MTDWPKFYSATPVVVQAMQVSTTNWRLIETWANGNAKAIGNWKHENDILGINVKENGTPRLAAIGDWVIRLGQGQFQVCYADVFAATYKEDTSHE